MSVQEEKGKLLNEALVVKGVIDKLSGRYNEAKSALRALMEEDGESSFSGPDGGRAFYKGGEDIFITDASTVARLFEFDELVEIVADKKTTKKNFNFLNRAASGRDISSAFRTAPKRTFTLDPPRSAEEKEIIERAIEKSASEATEEVEEMLRRFEERVRRDGRSPKKSARAAKGNGGRKKAAKKKAARKKSRK